MPEIAYDVESTGLYVHEGSRMFAFSTCDTDRRISIHRLDGSVSKHWNEPQTTPANARRSKRVAENLWRDPRNTIVLHNAPLDIDFTEDLLGRDLRDHPIKDTISMSQILQNRHPGHALARLGYDLAEYSDDSDKMIKRYTRGGHLNFQQIPRYDFDRYQHDDAVRTMLLNLFFWPMIVKNGWQELHQMECDLTWTVLDMRRRGVMIDRAKCNKLISWLRDRCEQDRRNFHAIAGGRAMSPANDGHIRYMLFTKLKLPVLKRTEETKQPSVDKDTLLELKEMTGAKIIDIVLRFKAYRTGISKIETYMEKADANDLLHPDIRRTGAKTGRQSCSNPNLFNVSKKQAYMNPYPIPARTCIRPRPGYVNFSIDEKGIEMRLIIDASGDEHMARVLREGGDVHDEATEVFLGNRFRRARARKNRGKKAMALYKLLRDAGKSANFAKPYGGGDDAISRILGLRGSAAHSANERYDAEFPGIASFSRRIADEVREEGHVHTAYGRQLDIPRDSAYMGPNYKIQGNAAGKFKRGQIRVNNRLRRETGDEVRLILPIYDELIIECPRKRLKDMPDVLKGIRSDMTENYPQFNVPFDIDIEYCTSDWANLKDYRHGG